MTAETTILEQLLRGSRESWPLALRARLCDLRPRFIPKCQVGSSYRAISRNGRVLLASNEPLTELLGFPAHVRLQTWHKAILPDDPPQPYGIVFCVRLLDRPDDRPLHSMRLVAAADPSAVLALDVGGGHWLEFRRAGA